MRRLLQRLYHLLLKNYSSGTRHRYARLVGVQIGKNCRLYSANFSTEPYLISIGNRVTITHDVDFITHDGAVERLRDLDPKLDFAKPIIVEDDVFIGAHAVIMPGVIIHSNSVVGAGAVVSRDVPSGTIVGGVPAKVITTIEEYRQKLGQGVPTKHLKPDEKRAILLRTWGTKPEERKAKLLESRSQSG